MSEIEYAWENVPEEDFNGVLEKIEQSSDLGIWNDDNTSLQEAPLSFFTKFKLIRAWCLSSIPPFSALFLGGKDGAEWDVTALDGEKETVFELLGRAGLKLDKNNVIDYARFVLDNVYTEHGSLRLIDDVDSVKYSSEPTPAQLKRIGEIVRPVKITEEKGRYLLDAIIFFGDTIFQSDIEVKKDGIVDILNEKILERGYPTRPIFLE